MAATGADDHVSVFLQDDVGAVVEVEDGDGVELSGGAAGLGHRVRVDEVNLEDTTRNAAGEVRQGGHTRSLLLPASSFLQGTRTCGLGKMTVHGTLPRRFRGWRGASRVLRLHGTRLGSEWPGVLCCRAGLCAAQCLPGSLGSQGHSAPNRDRQSCLQTLSSVPWEAKLPQVETEGPAGTRPHHLCV